MALGKIVISEAVAEKLATKHKVSKKEILQCFANRQGGFLEDSREEHRTNPPTQWFVAETNGGRLLKVIFVVEDGKNDPEVHIKSAYEPSAEVVRIYEKFA